MEEPANFQEMVNALEAEACSLIERTWLRGKWRYRRCVLPVGHDGEHGFTAWLRDES